MSAGRPVAGTQQRFVDAHMHLWDLDAHAWYRFPAPGESAMELHLPRAFPARYLLDDYLESVSSVDLVKCVHVSAVTDPADVEAESAWIAAFAGARGLPTAIIGALDLALPVKEIEAHLEREMCCPAYRGIRLLGGIDYATPLAESVLAALLSRGLVYDAVAFPGGGIEALAQGIARFPDLPVVLEHTGWPVAGRDPAVFDQWRREMAQLAELPNVSCKLSGLAMALHCIEAEAYRPYLEECVALFGAHRCMFATNFPVDISYGAAQDLLALFAEFAAACSEEEAADLWWRTAERCYRM